MLTDEQVVTCASVLLYAMLSESAALDVWVTDLVTLRLLVESAESDCPADLQRWLRGRDVTVYVVACLGPYGFVHEGDGHFICLAFDTPSAEHCKVRIYDSKGFDSISWRWSSMRAEITDACRWVCRTKYDADPPPRAEIVPVALEDMQLDNASCGYHVALFVAQDVAERSLSKTKAQERLAQLRNCPSNAGALREWMEQHSKWFGQQARSLGSPEPDRMASAAALEELSDGLILVDPSASHADTEPNDREPPRIRLLSRVWHCFERCCGTARSHGSAREPLRGDLGAGGERGDNGD